MIRVRPKIHDSQTLEFKIGYETRPELHISQYVTNLWMFIPENLEPNEKIYVADSFYEDLKTRLRLITPQYSLAELCSREALPYRRIRQALEADDAEAKFHHQVCRTCAIMKACLRDAAEQEKELGTPDELIQRWSEILQIYRQFSEKCGGNQTLLREHKLGDEFLCQITLRYLYPIARLQPGTHLNRFLLQQQTYMQQHGYALPAQGDDKRNRHYVHRMANLRKFIESDLYITSHKKNSGYLLEQLMFMLSAGLAMAFALLINYYTQGAADNFSLPLILLTIVSYMFKDRIKDWVRAWFRNGVGGVFYDRRIRLEMNGMHIGSSRQGVGYKDEENLPEAVRKCRLEASPEGDPSRYQKEDILQYRRHLRLNRKRINRLSHHPLLGVDEICRLNLSRLMRWMDDPQTPVYHSDDDGSVETFSARHTYIVHIILEIETAGETLVNPYRVEISRDGILSIS